MSDEPDQPTDRLTFVISDPSSGGLREVFEQRFGIDHGPYLEFSVTSSAGAPRRFRWRDRLRDEIRRLAARRR